MKSIGKAISSSLFESHPDFNWNSYVGNVQSGASQGGTVSQYLTHFAFANGGSLAEFKNKNHVFVTDQTLEQIEARV